MSIADITVGWAVVDGDEDGIHVIPTGDLIAHVETPRCVCCPSWDDGIWIHQAFDERTV